MSATKERKLLLKVRRFAKKHPLYQEHQRVSGALQSAVKDQHNDLQRLVRCKDDPSADSFTASHYRMRRLQRRLWALRHEIADAAGVPRDLAYLMF